MKRDDIQKMLEEFQEAFNETPHVYFQPPDNVKMSYPCFVYSYSDVDVVYANDGPYLKHEEYDVKYITKKADPSMFDSLLGLQSMRFDRHYTYDGLHHYAFVLSTPMVAVSSDIDLSSIEQKYI